MGRVGIASRLTLIVACCLVLVQMFTAVAYYVDRRHASQGATFAPLLGQIAALTQVLDRVPVVDRDVVLRAATGIGFLPSLRADVPESLADMAPLPRIDRRLKRLLGEADDRFVAAYLITDSPRSNRPIIRLRELVGARLHAVVGLKSGGYLDVEVVGDLTTRLFGVPAGLLAGILGFVVALIGLVAVRRETRPLTELAAAVETIGLGVEPRLVEERGAPEVRVLVRSVNAMQARIAELVRNRTMVIGAISHDLRTYLTRLRLRLELLPDSNQRTKASSDVEGMQALIDDALAFARSSFEHGDEKVVDIACLLQQECDSRKTNGEAVSLTGADAPLWVRGSPAALARVAANLVGNALAYGQCAELSLTQHGDFADLCVEDRGPGIPVADREKVFEPFYRLEPSRSRAHGGAGLGLSIVRQIVESCRGTIAIEDRPGGGARIRVRLLCADLAGNAVINSHDPGVFGGTHRAYRPSTA